MKIGAALVLLAVGAILRFAITTVSWHGVDLQTVGVILMIVGAIGLLLWLFVWAPWVRNRRATTTTYRETTPLDDERYAHGVRRTDYYEDQFPR